MSLATGVAYPEAKPNISNFTKMIHDQENRHKVMRMEIKARAESLAADIVGEYLQRKPHRSAHGDFSQFPSVELARAMRTEH